MLPRLPECRDPEQHADRVGGRDRDAAEDELTGRPDDPVATGEASREATGDQQPDTTECESPGQGAEPKDEGQDRDQRARTKRQQR